MGKRMDAIGPRQTITMVNPTEREYASHDYVLWFGGCGTTNLRVWADSLEDALEIAADWLKEHAPGHIMPHWAMSIRN